MPTKFELYVDKAGEWRWRLRHGNGRIVADGAEGYSSKDACLAGIASVREHAATAPLVELPPTARPAV